MHVQLDEHRCIQSGTCVAVAPRVFSQDEAGNTRVVTAEVPPAEQSSVTEAIDLCPVAALIIDTDRAS